MAAIIQQALHELGLAGDFPEPSQQSVDAAIKYVADAPEIEKFEGGKFSLCKKDNFYILKKSEQVVGWAQIGEVMYNSLPYHTLDVIYILPKFRQTKATLLLVYGVKEILPHPIIVDGMLFVKGKELLDAIHTRERYKISIVDKKSGQRVPYNSELLTADTSKNFVIVEALNLGFYGKGWLPGQPDHKTYITILEHLHDIEYN